MAAGGRRDVAENLARDGGFDDGFEGGLGDVSPQFVDRAAAAVEDELAGAGDTYLSELIEKFDQMWV